MGRDKAALRLGNRLMLSIIRSAANRTGYPVRVIRRDLISRCGPLGGIWTALIKSSAERVLFLACDTPFVSTELITHVLSQTEPRRALFTRHRSRAGFPFVVPAGKRELVKEQIEKRDLSLQTLAQRLHAVPLKLPRRFSSELMNVNTPANYAQARKAWEQKHS